MAAIDALPTETIQLAEESLRRCAGDAFFPYATHGNPALIAERQVPPAADGA